MTATSIVVWLIVGLIAGALASRVVEGGGLGILGDIVVGIIGAFLGGWLLYNVFNVAPTGGVIMDIVVAFIGAVILLVIVRLVTGGMTRRRL